ncbi:MAG: porin PorA family protein, partial [Ilumatobacteraceae bacterium]
GFRTVVAPALVRFPLDVDQTVTYTGTALTYVDPATLLPLAKPKREPLQISRRVKVVSGTFSKAVIDETVTVKTGGTTTVETYQYVIDRRSMQMVSDPRQYAFGDPKAIMHAARSYRVNFAMGTNAKGSYLAYIPEEDAVSHMVLVEGPHTHPDAHIRVLDFSSKRNGPVAPYYLAHLKQMGLPMQVTASQLAPVLAADGIDVNRALADVGPFLTPAEKALVSATLAKSVPLHYFFLSDGLVSIEPKTGTLIDVHTHQQGIAVQPDLSGASVLRPMLNKYAAIPSVRALSNGLAALAKRAPPVAESYTYTQTVPSSLAVTKMARDHVRTMNLIDVRVPAAIAVLGFIVLGLGLILSWRSRRHRKSDRAAPLAAIPTEPIATEPVTTSVGAGRNPEGK